MVHQSNLASGVCLNFKYFRNLRANVSSVTFFLSSSLCFFSPNESRVNCSKSTHACVCVQTNPFNSFNPPTLAMNKLRKCVFMLDRAYKMKKQQKKKEEKKRAWRTPFNISGISSSSAYVLLFRQEGAHTLATQTHTPSGTNRQPFMKKASNQESKFLLFLGRNCGWVGGEEHLENQDFHLNTWNFFSSRNCKEISFSRI